MRQKQLSLDLDVCPIRLNSSQKIIVNHYLRTAVCIINGLLELNETEDGCTFKKEVILNSGDYKIIKQELNEINIS